MNNPPLLCIVIPCFNEEEVLNFSLNILTEVLTDLQKQLKISTDSYICCVDDGSRDSTWSIIAARSKTSAKIRGIKLSNNFGHQNALIAGLLTEYHHADCLLTMDADLQHDVSAIEVMIDAFENDAQIVYGISRDRIVDSFLKRWLANGFYALMKRLNPHTITNHADFRLAGREVIAHLAEFGEVNLFLRNIFPLIGFPSTCVYYERKPRLLGQTKYPLRKQIAFAWQGVTSFSTAPLRLIFRLGGITCIVAVALSAWVVWTALSGRSVHGWASTLLPLLFFSGLMMLALGIIGEYIGKIYQEVKHRPRFIIETQTKSNI